MATIKTGIFLSGAIMAAALAQAHDGDYYNAFGDRGRAQYGFAPSLDIATGFVNFVDLVVQPDGKVLVSATVDNKVATTPSTDMGLLRLNANGTLDTGFGSQGQIIIPFDLGGSNNDAASSILLQPNGRIVLCGTAAGDETTGGGSDFAIARVLANGAPDTQFSGDGKQTIAFDLGPAGSRDDTAVRCSLQGDGKIVAAGSAAYASAGSARMAVARLNVDGSRDTTFNGTGTATVDFGTGFAMSNAFSVKSLSNNSSLLVGGASGTGGNKWAFARLDASGQLDTTYGNGGIVLFDPSVAGYAAFEALDAYLLPDNSAIAVGVMLLSSSMSNFDFGIYKFLPNGSLDTSFGNGGGQIIAFDLGGGFTDAPVKIVRDAQGRYLIGGFAQTNSAYTIGLVRLDANGQLDPSFGVGGKLTASSTVPLGTDYGDQGTSVALAPDGSIFAGSIATYNASSHLHAGVVKLVGDTIFDDSFELH
ncbi:MAG: delta-60 repeat domain-containing protein [Dokdonella sp.]